MKRFFSPLLPECLPLAALFNAVDDGGTSVGSVAGSLMSTNYGNDERIIEKL